MFRNAYIEKSLNITIKLSGVYKCSLRKFINLLETSHVKDVTPRGKLLKISKNSPKIKIGKYCIFSRFITKKKNINIEAILGNTRIAEKNLIGTAENAEKNIMEKYSKKFLTIEKNLLFPFLNIIIVYIV